MEEKLSYLNLSRVVNYLRALGVYPIDQSSSRKKRWWHAIYRFTSLFLVVIYVLQQMIKIYIVRHDTDKVINTMFVFLTFSAYIYKNINNNVKSKQIDRLLDILKGPIFNQGEPEHREPLLKTVKRSLTVSKVYNLVAVFTSIFMYLHPTVLHLQGKLTEFQTWLPFDSNEDPQFYVALFYNWFHNAYFALTVTMSDMLMVFLMEQCKTQITILRLDIKNVVEKSKAEQIKTKQTFTDIFERRFKNIVLHHNEIVSMTAKIDDIFGGSVLYQFVLGGWILCTSAYNINNLKIASVGFMSISTYMLAVLIEYFLYCYYGNDLTVESEMLVTSLYEMDWLSLSIKHRRSVLILMERCKRPITPMAGKIIPLSNKSFTSILQSSFSFYTFLKELK